MVFDDAARFSFLCFLATSATLFGLIAAQPTGSASVNSAPAAPNEQQKRFDLNFEQKRFDFDSFAPSQRFLKRFDLGSESYFAAPPQKRFDFDGFYAAQAPQKRFDYGGYYFGGNAGRHFL